MHVMTFKKRTIYVSVSCTKRYIHSKFNKNILETELLNLSNPEKSVVSAGKLFHILNNSNAEKIVYYS